jgi:hypothetical protein
VTTDLGNTDFLFDSEFVDAPEPETPGPSDQEVVNEIKEFAEEKPQSPRAKRYTKEVAKTLSPLWRALAQHPATVADSATILTYGPDLARAVGNLADEDEKARKVIDFIVEGGGSPYIPLLSCALPMAIQILRNHEPTVEAVKGFRIPFTKRTFRLPFKLRLGKLRNASYDPDYLTTRVFSHPELARVLAEQGVTIAYPASRNGSGPQS